MENDTMPFQHDSSTSLWHDQSFVLFWSGKTISLLGSAITSVVLPILVYRLTGSAFLTSLLATFEVLPYFIFSLFAGEVADRVNRRWQMVSCDVLNTLLLGSIPVAGWFHALTLPHIFVVALLSASAFVWFDAAEFGALPILVGRERLMNATSAISSVSSVVGIVGPALGGGLAATIGSASTISFDAGSYLLSAISLILIPRAFSIMRLKDQTSRSSKHKLLDNVREGMSFLWHHELVRILTLLSFGLSLTGGAVNGLLVVYAVQALHLSSSDARIGFLFAASSVGSLAASLLLPRLTKHSPVGWITLGAMGLNLFLLLLLALIASLNFALVVYACWGLSYSLAATNGKVLRQMVIPDHLQSRVNTYARMIAWGGTPFGAALGGLITQTTTIRTAYLTMAVVLALSTLIGWSSPLRERAKISELTRDC
jgi:MFS family permease